MIYCFHFCLIFAFDFKLCRYTVAAVLARRRFRTMRRRRAGLHASLKAGRCRLTLSKPVLKAPMVSALETLIS